MRLTQGWQGRAALLLLAVLIYTARVWWMDDGRYVLYDDAFISFRYARNLAHGYGLVFNPGQRVEGYTNFLWVTLLAGAIRLGGDVIWVAKAAGVACGVLVVVLTMLLAGRLVPEGGVWTAFPALLLAATASLPRYALSGMETLMFSVWLCLALMVEMGPERRWRPPLVGLILALAALTRPEGVLFCGVLAAAATVEQGVRTGQWTTALRGGLIRLASFTIVYAPYFAWRYAYYGHLLPNTFYAKAGGLSLSVIGRGLRYLRDTLLLTNPSLATCGLCGFLSFRRHGAPAALTAVGAYLVYVIAVGGDDWQVFGPRFLLVIFPWIAVLGWAGLMHCTSRHAEARRLWLATTAAALLAVTGGLSLFEATAYRGVTRTMNRGWWATAERLAIIAVADELVAVDAAGIIPFHTDLPTIDMLGLNDVHIAHLPVASLGSGLAGHEKFDPRYVLDQRPTYITTWLDSQGQPLSAGLGQVAGRLGEQYELTTVVLMREPEPGEPVWLDLSTATYTEELHWRGYIYGIFRLRTGEGLGGGRRELPIDRSPEAARPSYSARSGDL